VIVWSVRFGRAPWRMLRPCQALFVILVYVGGPMLIVNQILKNTYGLEFGECAFYAGLAPVPSHRVRRRPLSQC
jgi:hypothetical protein